MTLRRGGKYGGVTNRAKDNRLHYFASGVILLFLIIFGRLFQLQILGHETYLAEAASEHEVYRQLPSKRGEIFAKDGGGAKTYPVVLNKNTYTLYIEPVKIIDKKLLSEKLATLLGMEEEEILAKIKPDDPYELITRGLSEETVKKIIETKLAGIGFEREDRRLYPDSNVFSHVIGFVGQDEKGSSGKYGIEGFWDKSLVGRGGFFRGERDALGRLIRAGKSKKELPENGADIILTIDRTIQFFACDKLQEFVKKFGAGGGSVIIMNPYSGAILAMCSFPDFNPNEYSKVSNFSVYKNPAIADPYEPGSIFKPITMAAGLDTGKVEPSTTYEDKGVVKIGPHEITNSDLKTNGVQTMTQVLEKSLNTGVVFVARQLGRELFRKYVIDFGFGSLTGIELDKETSGDISNLGRRGEIYYATASFGQGIAVTPIQLVTAFSVIANGGKLIKPFIVSEIRNSNGVRVKTETKIIRQVISEKTASLVGSMMTAVVENGHGKRAGVPGYFVAGKTGTAQIPHPSGGYYQDETIGSFVGFAPTVNPRFVMLVRIVRPQGVRWAESTAAPLFGEIAKLLLDYFEVPPERK